MNGDTLYTRSGALEMLGETLLQAQNFERSLGYCVGLVFSGRQKIGIPELDEISSDACRITLGQFIARLNQRCCLCDDLEQKLKSALDGRNRMAHRIVDDPEFDLDNEAGRRRLVLFLLKLRAALVELDLIFASFQMMFLEDLGVTAISELKHQRPDLFDLINSVDFELLRTDDASKHRQYLTGDARACTESR